MVTVSRLEKDSWGQLHTSKHNYYRIMTIASKALHQIKHNWGSPGYNMINIEYWLQAFLPRELLSSSTYLRSCAVHVIHTRVSIFLALSILQQTYIRNYYKHTYLDQAYIMCEVWLSITDATECSFLDLLEQSNSHLNHSNLPFFLKHPKLTSK